MDPVVIYEWGRNIFAAIALLMGGAGGVWAYLKKARGVAEGVVVDEWKELAEVRGETIDDMEGRLQKLEDRITHLEGAYAAMQSLKATEIADEVVARLEGLHLVDV